VKGGLLDPEEQFARFIFVLFSLDCSFLTLALESVQVIGGLLNPGYLFAVFSFILFSLGCSFVVSALESERNNSPYWFLCCMFLISDARTMPKIWVCAREVIK